MKIAEKSFTAEGIEFPAGSFVVPGPPSAGARAAVEELGLTAAALSALPAVPMHDAAAAARRHLLAVDGTQDLGWYRLTFDKFGIPYDLIYKEQVKKGNLRKKYDVILMAAQNINRQAVLQAPAARPQPYQKSEKYKFLGMYGETPDMSGGFGQDGVDAFAKFLEAGGTLIAAGAASASRSSSAGRDSGRRRIADRRHGAAPHRPGRDRTARSSGVLRLRRRRRSRSSTSGGTVFRVGVADQARCSRSYVGGDASVLSGLMVGADQLRQRVRGRLPNAYNGKGRVLLFANNPIYRWQNHGEFNMVFNSLLNWNYVPAPPPLATPAPGSAPSTPLLPWIAD